MKKSISGLFAFSFLLCSAAFAQSAVPSADAKSVDSVVRVKQQEPKIEDFPVLQKIKELGGTDDATRLEFDYLGKQFGVDMFLVSGAKMMQTVHVLPSGAAIIGGTLASPEGQDVSAAVRQNFAENNKPRADAIVKRVQASMKDDKATPATTTVPAAVKPAVAQTGEAIWARMAQLGIVHLGADKEAPVVYVVIDPTQAPSKEAFAKLEPFAAQKKIDLRIVPISLNSAETIMDIAAVLAGSNPVDDLKAVMAGKKVDSKEPPKPEGALGLKNNADFVEALKLGTLPSLFYRHSDKEPIRVIKGMPKDWSIVFKELGLE